MAPRARVRYATAGVGTTPANATRPPAASIPPARAADRTGEDSRVCSRARQGCLSRRATRGEGRRGPPDARNGGAVEGRDARLAANPSVPKADAFRGELTRRPAAPHTIPGPAAGKTPPSHCRSSAGRGGMGGSGRARRARPGGRSQTRIRGHVRKTRNPGAFLARASAAAAVNIRTCVRSMKWARATRSFSRWEAAGALSSSSRAGALEFAEAPRRPRDRGARRGPSDGTRSPGPQALECLLTRTG